MSQHYSNPARENDPHALPNIEVFELTAEDVYLYTGDMESLGGWFWQACFPGCLPDSEPVGPFASRTDALADAQNSDA